MRKIFLGLSMIALLSGCGENEQMMTCTSENSYNGLTSGTEYQVTYNDDEVTHVRIIYNYNQENHTDGVGTGTDGTTEDEDVLPNNNGVVDGAVGEVTDDIIGGIYNTILDLSGLKNRHTNQINNTNINGFTGTVQNNTDTSYKVVYDLDLTTIDDNDISRFNVDRSYTTLRRNYTNQGLTCK